MVNVKYRKLKYYITNLLSINKKTCGSKCYYCKFIIDNTFNYHYHCNLFNIDIKTTNSKFFTNCKPIRYKECLTSFTKE